MTPTVKIIPEGLCACGCGTHTRIAPYSNKIRGWQRGVPIQFVTGHNRTKRRPSEDNFDTSPYGLGCRAIPLTKGQFAIVDKEDYEWLSSYNWQADWSESNRAFYARRGVRVNGKVEHISMHREILGLARNDERIGDHVNSSQTLNNRRSNLRIANPTQSAQNRGLRKDNKSGETGVYRKGEKWRAHIRVDGALIHIGTFEEKAQAVVARKTQAAQFFRDFAPRK